MALEFDGGAEAAEYEAFRDVATPTNLTPCFHCGRKFFPEVLGKHQNVCSKVKKRKAFNSQKQRLQELGITEVPKEPESATVQKKANWRQKHKDLVQTMKVARGEAAPAAPTVNPDYVQCPHCERNFNAHAAERHMPFCKEKQARVGIQTKSKADIRKEKLGKRTQYKPPLPGGNKANTSNTTVDSTPPRTKTHLPAGSPSSSGLVKRSPAGSAPTSRRHDNVDATDSRPFKKCSSASPPMRRKNIPKTKEAEYVIDGYMPTSLRKTQSMTNEKALNRISSGSSTDSDPYPHTISNQKSPGSVKSSRKPTWYEDLKSPTSDKSSARLKGRPKDENVYDFPDKATKDKNLLRRDSGIDFDEVGHESKRNAAVGVVRPSSRRDERSEQYERTPSGRRKLANFCHECGTKYPVPNAKYCCECGTRRMHIEV